MARGKPRSPKKRIVGTYPVGTGTVDIVADPLRDGAFVVELNRVPSSYVVLGAPRVLGFDYMEWIASAVRAHFSLLCASPTTLLHLGAAGCSLPRFCADVWPESSNIVVDIDRALCELIATTFDLPPQIAFRYGDAGEAVDAMPAGSVDVIIRDVFAGPTTPEHVASPAFYRAAEAALAPGGIYLANVGDRVGHPVSQAELAGMAEVFDEVGTIATPEVLSSRTYGNVVVYGLRGDSSLTLPDADICALRWPHEPAQQCPNPRNPLDR